MMPWVKIGERSKGGKGVSRNKTMEVVFSTSAGDPWVAPREVFGQRAAPVELVLGKGSSGEVCKEAIGIVTEGADGQALEQALEREAREEERAP